MSLIRRADIEDLSKLVLLGEQMHQESRYSRYEFSIDACFSLARHVLTDERTVCFVAEENDNIVGMFIGQVAPMFFSTALTAYDLALYIAPEHRHGRHAVRLVRAYVEWAQSLGVENDAITVGVSADIDDEKAIRLYQALGFVHSATILRKAG